MTEHTTPYAWLKGKPDAAKNLVELAKKQVPDFRTHYEKFEERIVLGGYSNSTRYNYSRAVAHVGLHFNKAILDLTPDEVSKFLYKVALEKEGRLTYFKHTVYGLRFFFKIYEKEDILFCLPKIKHEKKLPVVFSRQELIRFFRSINKLKYRVLFMLIYSAGLRIGELTNLKLYDIDFDRNQIRIKKTKGRCDRYVMLSTFIRIELKRYIEVYKPEIYLFNGKYKANPLGASSIRQTFHVAIGHAAIHKKVCVHTLRHSYATHMLEDGVDIVSIKEAMGHAKIESTLLYLHVARVNRKNAFSPLDTLYN